MKFVWELDGKMRKPVAEMLLYRLTNPHGAAVKVLGIYTKVLNENERTRVQSKLVEFKITGENGNVDNALEELKKIGQLWEVRN